MVHMGCNAATQNLEMSKLNPTQPNQTMQSDAYSYDSRIKQLQGIYKS